MKTVNTFEYMMLSIKVQINLYRLKLSVNFIQCDAWIYLPHCFTKIVFLFVEAHTQGNIQCWQIRKINSWKYTVASFNGFNVVIRLIIIVLAH